MSTSLKAAEITVRVIVLVLQIMALIGGAVLIGLFPENPGVGGIGGATIIVAAIVSIYEVIMIVFALIKGVNHSARLVVDIILNSVMAGLTVLATIGVTIIAVILFVALIGFAGIIIAIFALPIGLGVIYSIAFIVSAIAAGIIRSKLINEARERQSSSVVLAPPPGQPFVLVQQPMAVGQGTVYPPSYNTTFGAPTAMPATGDPGTNYNYNYQPGYQGGYPLATGVAGEKNAVPGPALSYGQKPGVSAP